VQKSPTRFISAVLISAVAFLGWTPVSVANASTPLDPYLVELAQQPGSAQVIMPTEVALTVGLTPREEIDQWSVVDIEDRKLTELAATKWAPMIAENQRLSLMQTAGQPPAIIGSFELNNSGLDGRGWNVAVLDTGTATSHPAFQGKVVAEACFTQKQCAGGSDQAFGSGSSRVTTQNLFHGTHVAAIAVGRAGNYSGTEFRGVAPAAGLVSIRVFTLSTSGEPYSTDAELLKALTWVRDNHEALKIASVNMSLGNISGTVRGRACGVANPAMTSIFAELNTRGVPVVVATGNAGRYTQISYPACVPTAIPVGATDANDKVANFSDITDDVLLAPGDRIISALIDGGLGSASGTSASAPVVAGALAVLRQVQPNLTPAGAMALLRETGVPVDDVTIKDLRRIDLPMAVQKLRGLPLPEAPSRVFVSQNVPGKVTVTWEVAATRTPSGFLVRLGEELVRVAGTVRSYTFDVMSEGKAQPFVAVLEGSLRSNLLAGPEVTTQMIAAAPTAQIASFPGFGEYCTGVSSLILNVRATTKDPKAQGFRAWWADEPLTVFSGGLDLPTEASQGNLQIRGTRSTGLLKVAVLTPAGLGSPVSLTVADNFVMPTPAVSATRTATGWLVQWSFGDLPTRAKHTATRIIVDGTVKEVPAATREFTWADVDGKTKSIAVCTLGTSTFNDASGAEKTTTGSSLRVEATLPRTALPPTAVSNLQLISRGQGSVQLTWGEAFGDPDKPLLGYRIEIGAKKYEVAANTSTLTVDGLPAGAVTAKITPYSDLGTGPTVSASGFVTGYAGAEIRSLTARSGSQNEIRLSWDLAPGVDPANVKSFTIKASTLREIVLPGTARETTIAGLNTGEAPISITALIGETTVTDSVTAFVSGVPIEAPMKFYQARGGANTVSVSWTLQPLFADEVARIQVSVGKVTTTAKAGGTSVRLTKVPATSAAPVTIRVTLTDGRSFTDRSTVRVTGKAKP
jgi:hypothetical protein